MVSVLVTWIVAVGSLRLVFPRIGFETEPELVAHAIGLACASVTLPRPSPLFVREALRWTARRSALGDRADGRRIASRAPGSRSSSSRRRCAVAIAIVDPLREFLSQDDGWAYARMVEHLLKTGEYRLDAWSAANMPVQIYVAAGLAKVFGYSLALLRIATLLLLVAGLAAFVALLRELDVEPPAAAVFALGLLASPLVAMLAFTFMSDVQFMAWLLIATWLYVRGVRRESDATVLLASLAAGCAIGTRQFGVAVIGGLLLAGLLARLPSGGRPGVACCSARRSRCWSDSGSCAPAHRAQFHAGRAPARTALVPDPTAARFRARDRLANSDCRALPRAVDAAGAALCSLAWLVVAEATGAASRGLCPQPDARPRVLIALVVFALLLIAALDKSEVTTRENSGRALQLYWMLPNSFWDHHVVMHGLASRARSARSFWSCCC